MPLHMHANQNPNNDGSNRFEDLWPIFIFALYFQDVHNLTDLSGRKGCNETDYRDYDVNGTVVVVARGDCNFVLKAALAQSYGAVGIVIASDELVSYARTTMSIAQLLWLLGVIVALR